MTPGMSQELHFYFDVGSPWAYLASARLVGLQAATGVVANWRPLLLGGVFRSTGNRPPIEVPAKAKYLRTDLHRCAKRYKIPLHMNDRFPVNTLQSMRVLTAAKRQQPQHFTGLCAGLFSAMWVDNQDLGDSATLQRTVNALVPEGAALWAAAQSQPIKDALREETDRAVERGVFGAPTFFLQSGGDAEMFFGQDRIDMLQAILQGI